MVSKGPGVGRPCRRYTDRDPDRPGQWHQLHGDCRCFVKLRCDGSHLPVTGLAAPWLFLLFQPAE